MERDAKPTVKWPILPVAEYRERIARAAEVLDDHDLDAMVLFSPTNWHYYAGLNDPAQLHNRVWRSCLIVRREGEPVGILNGGYLACTATRSYLEDVRRCADEENPIAKTRGRSFYELFFATLDELDLCRATLGFETGSEIHTYLSFDEYEMIRERLAHARIVSADPAIWTQRRIKTPWEQQVIREGARLACECTRAAFETIRPGRNELDVHRAYWSKAAELGMIEAPTWGTWTCFTTNASEPAGFHRWITGPVDRVIQPGDMGVSDGGPTYRGYQFDFQRTFCVGDPSDKLLHYHGIATGTLLETIDRVRPGISMRELFAFSLDAQRKRGYDYPHVISFIGHQQGLSHHEPPWITAGEEAFVEPGMVMSIEIGAFDPELEVLGSFPEDLILATEQGPEILSGSLSHELWVAS